MEEILDVYTREGEYLGTKTKSFCHGENPGCYHKPVWIWIINDENEILIQKRSKFKKHHPNKWDMPSVGHVVAGESLIDGAIRETYEELGIITKAEDYKFLFEYIYDKNYEIAEVYMLKLNLSVDEMKLQENEVAEVKWLRYEEFKEIFLSEEFCPQPIDYKERILEIFRCYGI